MRSIKTTGLATLVAMVVMAFVGATSASATFPTQLCTEHVGSNCPEGAGSTSIHQVLATGTVGKLLNSLITILCLGVLVEADPLALGSPQEVHTLSSAYTGCGSSSAHNNCTVTVEEEPLALLLKTGLDEGSLTVDNGRTRLVCSNLGVDCKYDTAGSLFAVSAGHLTANKTPTTELGGKFFCPNKGELDGLLETLVPSYILGGLADTVSLCKTHSPEKCAEKDQVKSLHMVTTKPPVLYNTIANIECESSLGTATALEPAEPQKLDVTELTWKECHTQGAAGNCTVTSKALPTLDLEQTELNLGAVTTLGLKVGIDCLVLGLIELDCVYGSDVTLQAEGALHNEGTGHGMFTADKVVLKRLEGGGHCPESVKWDALYEPLEDVYIVE